jgi:aldehyde:ferredoxin oxidoreductase
MSTSVLNVDFAQTIDFPQQNHMFYEPLPSNSAKGKAADRTSVRESVQKYYQEVGWDENGVPKSEALKKLELGDVDKALRKLRK